MTQTPSDAVNKNPDESPQAQAARFYDGAGQAAVPAGVLLQGPAYDLEEGAEECCIVALSLQAAGIPVQLAPTGSQDDFRRLLPEAARQRLRRLTTDRIELSRSVLFQHGAPSQWNMDVYGHCRIGRAMWNASRIPDGWAERCNAFDEVWLPSEFNRQAFAASGVTPEKIRVLPAGVDTHVFRPDAPALSLPHTRGFNFLSVYDSRPGTGMDLLLKAYVAEFKAEEDVALILTFSPERPDAADPGAQLAYFLEKHAGIALEKAPPIIVLEGTLPATERARLCGSAGAFVLATHGEACGCSLLEAMACELPVITTRYGGPLDFVGDQNSFLIDVEGMVPASPEIDERYAGQNWAQPSLEHLRQLMRAVYSQPETARLRGRQARQDMIAHRDWNAVAPLWVNEFRRWLP